MSKPDHAVEYNIRPKKAYNNYAFLNSPYARSIRVLCEFEEPEIRFRKERVYNTIVFFGSARVKPPEIAERNLAEINAMIEQNGADADSTLQQKKRIAERNVLMARYYADAEEISMRLSTWASQIENERERFIVCSGGGPGIMEAANRGANKAGARSIGLNISLPFEQDANPYQTPELAFEFHYFFIRKYWFFHLAKSLLIFPGGFGTLDEFFELLTLIQTEKTKRYFPIVLYGSEYWNEVLNFDAMVKWGTINEEDIHLFHISDSVDDAVHFVSSELAKHHLKQKVAPAK